MPLLRNIASGIRSLFQRKRADRELDEELRGFMEMAAEESMKQGRNQKEALRAVRLERGSVEAAKERVHSAGWESLLETFWRDLCYGLRMLRKSPGFTAVAVLTLALGIGANSTIFSWINSTILNPIPGVKNANQYVVITTGGNRSQNPISYPDYLDLRNRNQTFSSLVAVSPLTASLTANARPVRLWGLLVSANYFDALAVRPLLGRGFVPADDSKPGGAPLVVLSYHVWQNQFGGDSSIVGQTLEIDRHPFQVVGVAPRNFVGTQTGLAYDVWFPIAMAGEFHNDSNLLSDRGDNWILTVGHLKPGVSPAQAQADLNVLMQQNVKQFPAYHLGDYAMAVNPMWRAPWGANFYLHTILFLLLAISGVVLLLACANVANLLLVRSVARRREMAIRLSVGASRWRLIRQLLAESLILAVCGGAIAMLFTLWTAGSLNNFIPPVAEVPVSMSVTANHTVLLVTFLVSVLTGIIFGVLPALRSSSLEPVAVLKEEAGSASGGIHKTRLSSVLVVAQIAMSLLLLVCAGLFIRSVRDKERFNPGFNAHNVLLDNYDLSGMGYDQNSGTEFDRQLFDKLQTLPGVQSATIADWAPLGFAQSTYTIQAEGYVPRRHESMDVQYADVGPHYLHTLQIPLVAGRDFTVSDTSGSQPVAIVNQTFVERYWPGREAIGEKLHAGGTWYTVVGVARDSDYNEIGEKPEPFIYLPLFQDYSRHVAIYARTAGDPLALASPVQKAVHSLDADLPLFDLATLESRTELNTTSERMGGVFVGGFGILALVLAGIGIYGVLAYTTRQRTHELGIRLALGAQPADVMTLVLGQGLKLVVLGVGTGVLASFALTRLMSGLLYGISSTDPLTFVLVAVVLTIVALLACYIPARRAMRVDPMIALRYE